MKEMLNTNRNYIAEEEKKICDSSIQAQSEHQTK